MTDAELCTRVRKGDRDAAGEIQRRHEGTILRVMTQLNMRPNADNRQAARIALHQAARKFDPKKCRGPERTRFMAYAAVIIRNSLKDREGDKPGGMTINTGRAGRKAWPKQTGLAGIANTSTASFGSLAVLSPLPRVVCRLLADGIDPVKRLGLYRGELERIRQQAMEEVA